MATASVQQAPAAAPKTPAGVRKPLQTQAPRKTDEIAGGQLNAVNGETGDAAESESTDGGYEDNSGAEIEDVAVDEDQDQDQDQDQEDAQTDLDQQTQNPTEQDKNASQSTTASAEDDDEGEGEDVVPVGSVQNDGSIQSNDGQTIGHIAGDADPKALKGSLVDEAGDILNAAGDVVGRAVPNADGAAEGVEGVTGDAESTAEGVAEGDAERATGQVTDDVGQARDETEQGTADAEYAAGGAEQPTDNAQHATDDAEQPASDAQQATGEAVDGVTDAIGGTADQAGEIADNIVPNLDLSKPLEFGEDGGVMDGSGTVLGKLVSGNPEDLASATLKSVTQEGELIGEDGAVLGKVDLPQDSDKLKDDLEEQVKGLTGINLAEPLSIDEQNNVTDIDGNALGQLVEGDPKKLAEMTLKTVSTDGELIAEDGSVLGKVQLPGQAEGVGQNVEDQVDGLTGVDLSKPLSIDEDGNVTDAAGTALGKLTEGDPEKISKETLKKIERDGTLIDESNERLGKLELPTDGTELNPEGDEPKIDNSVLEGKTINKNGNIVDADGNVWGRLVEGDAKKLAGGTCDKEGIVWNDSGNQVGRGEALPEEERQVGIEAPFESFPDAKVQRNGDVVSDGAVVGKVVEGDLKQCEGKSVDADGDISDRNGNTIGRAERIEEEAEPEPEPEKDQSLLAGKRVNKQGNVVDEHGSLFGRVVEGDLNKVAGKMCGKDGTIWSESGEAIGRAELLPESERESKKDGPFANYDGCKVQKDGKVLSSPGGEVIGRLVQGDAKQLAGYSVDADGDVLDSNGNALGKAERWEEEEAPKQKHPCAGLKVNSDGNVVSEETGDIIGKLTEGTLEQCRGIEIDDDGDISNQKNQRIGHVTRIQDVQPEKTQEELDEEKRQQKEADEAEQDAKLVKSMSYKIEEAMDKVKPILRDITNYINEMEATKEEDRDEEKLVKQVKPLLEEGGAILDDLNKEIRSMDPDGRIQTHAKTKAAQREATPEEHKLAEQLKEMTGEVHRTIENGKKKIAGMPHAKKEINPLWGLLNEPLFQILAAVGLLLNGVLGLVGKLLGGLGLGGLVDNLLGNLGLDKLLKGFGLG